jgi:hypothetical protein
MMNLAGLWRALKLLSLMQQAEDRDRPGSEGRAGPDGDDGSPGA